jgi:hypothetical protein
LEDFPRPMNPTLMGDMVCIVIFEYVIWVSA